MADKVSFEEGASLNKPPLFCGVNYQLWCIRIKKFVSIDRKIWNVITNSSFIPLLKTNSVLSKNEKRIISTVLLRTSLFLLLILMNFLKFQSVSQLKRCGILLKEFTKIQEMLGWAVMSPLLDHPMHLPKWMYV